jgi:hypothetical protein
MSVFTTERGGITAPDYDPPNLFPLEDDYTTRAALRHYVDQRLLEMATSGELSITDLHNQSPACSEAAGMAILGQRFDEQSKTMVLDTPAPMSLQTYMVKIKSVHGDPIKYKIGREPKGNTIGAPRRDHSAIEAQVKYEDVWAVSDKKEVEVPLPEAWRIMHQNGKYCRPAPRPGLQRKYWLYEEVPRKKRGRPAKKDFTVK